MNPLNSIPSAEKHIIDAISLGAMLGALTNILPHIAAVFTIIWTGIRIYETNTVQSLLGRKPTKNKQED